MTFTAFIAIAFIALVIILGSMVIKGIRDQNKIMIVIPIIAIIALLAGMYFAMAYFITSM